MKTVFYSSQAQFDLTDDEFQSFIKSLENGKRVWIPRLKVFLSDMFIWAGEKPKGEIIHGRLHDGTKVIKRFGEWKDASNPNVILDQSYYPEIAKDEILNEEEYANAKLLEI